MKGKQTLPSPAMAVALVALLLALTGAASALPGKNTVNAGDIRKNAVRSQEIQGKSIKAGDVADDTLTSKQVKTDGLTPSDIESFEISDRSMIRVSAEESAGGIDAARAAAREVVLYEEDGLTIYAKCYRDVIAGETEGGIFARSSNSGALLATETGGLPNDDAQLLDPATPEPARQLHAEDVIVPDAGDFGVGDAALVDSDGTAFRVLTTIGAKQGAYGVGSRFGSGNTCLFAITALG